MATSISKTKDRKKSKNQLRRERAKLLKQQHGKPGAGVDTQREPGKAVRSVDTEGETARAVRSIDTKTETARAVTPEAGPEAQQLEPENGTLAELYQGIFAKFDASNAQQDDGDARKDGGVVEQPTDELIEENEEFEDRTGGGTNEQLALNTAPSSHINTALSNRQLKKLYAIPLYVLKAESKKPELVEWMDADAPDPRLYIYLKTLNNSVGIPAHWQSKKSFLSSKRGIERPPFELPQFIRDTGILEMRQNNDHPEDQSTLKQRMRERVQPKAGQLDIDYDKLYDAFFKYQKKPPLLKFGELYTETTNNEDIIMNSKISQLRVGVLSRRLKIALGMLDESGKVISSRPPWYQRMQELGPPPAYPHMRIEESGRITVNNRNEINIGPPIINRHWGMLVNDLDDDKDNDNQRDDNQEKGEENQKLSTKDSVTKSNFDRSRGDVLLNTFGETPSHLQKSSTPLPVGNPNTSSTSKHLYKVLKTKESGDQNSIFGSKTTSYKL